MNTCCKSTLVLFLSLAFSGAAQAPAAEYDCPAICQLMQIETSDLPTKLEAPETPARPDRNGSGAGQPQIDATPVISWVDPAVKLKAVLVCVHGLGLEKNSYAPFGQRMAREGYGVYAMDVRGFGEFQQLPGDRRCDFKKCLDDVCQGLKLARQIHPGVPVMVMGESMGGAIAMRVTEEHPELVDGLISSVPGASRHNQLGSSLNVGLKLIAGGGKAKVNVGELVVNKSTEKEDLRQKLAGNPLARFELSSSELIQFQNFMVANKKNADKITSTPVLMVQGTKDRLVKREDEDENLSTFGRIKCPDKMLVMVHNAEHLIFEEGQFDEDSIKAVTTWIDEHLSKSPHPETGPVPASPLK